MIRHEKLIDHHLIFNFEDHAFVAIKFEIMYFTKHFDMSNEHKQMHRSDE